jgi:hypothetical protein
MLVIASLAVFAAVGWALAVWFAVRLGGVSTAIADDARKDEARG